MKQIITLKPVRLNGKDIGPNKKVEIDDNIYKTWLSLGLAKDVPPKKDGEKNENKDDNSTESRTADPDGSKEIPES